LASFASQFNGTPVASASSAFQPNMEVNVAIQSARDVDLVSSQLSMQGAANLNLTGTLASPVILGRVNLTGGTSFFWASDMNATEPSNSQIPRIQSL
jgi:hypothetical protein